jgi:hypothetical protein
MTDINWGYNCLTQGVHHGRPEPLWDLPIHYAVTLFDLDGLKKIVAVRIYKDALQFIEHGSELVPPDWATKMRALAEERFESVYIAKLDEILQYYSSSQWDREVEGMIELLEKGTLNKHYQPRHPHDTINMLCRILGVGCARTAVK